MKDLQNGLGAQSISDLVLKEYTVFIKPKALQKKFKRYKMTKWKIFEKFGNLSEDRLNAKNNKEVYAKNHVMTTVVKRCRGEQKRGKRKIDAFRRKLMVPDSEITECPEYEVKSKSGNIFVNEKILLEYPVKIYEMDPYFYEP